MHIQRMKTETQARVIRVQTILTNEVSSSIVIEVPRASRDLADVSHTVYLIAWKIKNSRLSVFKTGSVFETGSVNT